MQLAARWVVLVAALAGAAVLNLDVDDATLALEATDATDIDAYVATGEPFDKAGGCCMLACLTTIRKPEDPKTIAVQGRLYSATEHVGHQVGKQHS